MMRSLLGVSARMSSKMNLNTQQRSQNRDRNPQAKRRPQRLSNGYNSYAVTPQAFSTVNVPKIGQRRVRMTENGMEITNTEIAFRVNRTATGGTVPEATDGLNFMFVNSSTPKPSPGYGNIGTDKWAGSMALLFDKYKVKKLDFWFKPSLPVTATGQVGLYFDPDTIPNPPLTLDAITGNAYAQLDHVSQKQHLMVRSSQMNRLPQYVTSAGSTEYQVGRMGVLFCVNSALALTSTVTGPVSLGVVMMTYTIEFINPSNAALASVPTIGPSRLKEITEQVVAEGKIHADKVFASERINLPVSTIDRLNNTLTTHVTNLVLAKLGHLEL